MEIYYACLCGFRTFFKEEAEEHIQRTERDGNEHKITSVFVDG